MIIIQQLHRKSLYSSFFSNIMMVESSSISARALVMSIIAGLFSLFAIAAISTISMQQDAYALNCREVDSRSHGECVKDRHISKEGFRDCVNARNCFATQTVNVQNSLSSSEKAIIDIDLQQLLNCGNENCLNINNQQEAFNDAFQDVSVTSGGNSVVDFDVDFEMSQTSDGGDKNVLAQDNSGHQNFIINAQNNAFVDTNGNDNDVEFVMDQINDECENSFCFNEAFQSYNLQASGTSQIDVNSNTGLNVNQLNVSVMLTLSLQII